MASPEDFRAALPALAAAYPYVLIDGILDCDRETRAIRAFKGSSQREPYFVGHFPDNPTMPGVLVLMAFVQAASLLYLSPVRLLKVDRLRFRSPVRPGMRLEIAVEELESTDGVRLVAVCGEVEGNVCVKGSIRLALERGNA